MKKFLAAALAVFSAAVPARAQTAETPDVAERDLPAVVSAVSLDEAMTMGLLDDEDGASPAQTAAPAVTAPVQNAASVPAAPTPAAPTSAQDAASAPETASASAAPASPDAEKPRDETDLDVLQAQFKEQVDKFMALFQDAVAKKESGEQARKEETPQKALKEEEAPQAAYYDENGVRITRNMAYVALSAGANKKLPELTGGDLQAAIAAIKTKPVQEKLALSTDGRLNALVVSGEAADLSGNAMKVSIDRNLAIPVISYDILHGTVRDGKGDEAFILSLTGEKIASEQFTQVEIHGFKAFTADTGKSFYISLFISPYLTIRLETTGENAKERAVAFFDNVDYAQLARAMKTLNVKETTQEVRAHMDKTLTTPDGRRRVADFYGLKPAVKEP